MAGKASNTAYSILVDVNLKTSDIQKQLDKLNLKPITLDVKLNTATLNSLLTSMGALETTMKNVDASMANFTQTAGDAIQKMNDAGNSANNTAKGMDYVGLSYQQANAIMSKSIDIISSLVDQVFEMDSALTEFKKVSDLSGQSLDNYIGKLQELGSTVGRTGSEMIEAATSFRKNSFNDEDSATLAQVATMYQNVADDAISAGDSADFIISQMKAFNIEAKDAMSIIDSVNEVSNNFAVSSTDLANNIGNMSSALAVGNNTFSESLSLLTAGTEITQQANKVSRSLVSVQSRLNQIVDESSDTGKALTAWYKEHNIAIYDQEGQLRSLYDVLKDVSEIWPTLTKNERAYYLNQQAGRKWFVPIQRELTGKRTS